MSNEKVTLKNFYMILFPLVFTATHEFCFFIFLCVKEGWQEAFRINTSFMRWLHFVKTADVNYYLICWLVPLFLTFVITYLLLSLITRSSKIE